MQYRLMTKKAYLLLKKKTDDAQKAPENTASFSAFGQKWDSPTEFGASYPSSRFSSALPLPLRDEALSTALKDCIDSPPRCEGFSEALSQIGLFNPTWRQKKTLFRDVQRAFECEDLVLIKTASRGGGAMPRRLPPPIPERPPAYVPEKPQAPEIRDNREIIHLVIGVFFDGSGNNAFNIDTAKLCAMPHELQPKAQASMEMFHKRCETVSKNRSYQSGLSNVAKLHEIYREYNDVPPGSLRIPVIQRRVYVQGIGTEHGQNDREFPDLALGRGKTGVLAKIDEAITKINENLQYFFDNNPNMRVADIRFDIFGFSRGATAARHFASLVWDVKGQQKLAEKHPLYPALRLVREKHDFYPSRKYHAYPLGKTRFLGLFDTVASVSKKGLKFYDVSSGDPPDINLHLPDDIAEAGLHLVAAHEYRENFSLVGSHPAIEELFIPGSHSDIGGGYPPGILHEEYYVSPMFSSEHPILRTPPEKTSAYRKAQKKYAALLANPALAALFSGGELAIDTWNGTAEIEHEDVLVTHASVRTSRKVQHGWAIIALFVMQRAAKQAKIEFTEIEGNDINYILPEPLKPLAEKLLSDEALSQEELNFVLAHYVHCSSSYVPARADGEQPGAPKFLIYVDKPAKNWQRVRHANHFKGLKS